MRECCRHHTLLIPAQLWRPSALSRCPFDAVEGNQGKCPAHYKPKRIDSINLIVSHDEDFIVNVIQEWTPAKEEESHQRQPAA